MTTHIRCACGESTEFRSPVLWREHYDKARPRSASARKEYAAIHTPNLVFDNAGRAVAPATEPDPRERRLVALLKEIAEGFDYIRLLEAEQLTLLKELMPEPPPLAKHTSTFFIGRAEVACTTCGRKTKWRKSTVPGGLPCCKNDIHKEAINISRGDTKGVSDNVWAIVLDEEVE